MNVFDKPGDSPSILAAKAKVRAGYGAVDVARKALNQAEAAEARARARAAGAAARPGRGRAIHAAVPTRLLVSQVSVPYLGLQLFKKDGSLGRVVPVPERDLELLGLCAASPAAAPQKESHV